MIDNKKNIEIVVNCLKRHGIRHVVISPGGTNITLYDANTALATIREAVGNDVNTVLGVAINEQLDDQVIVTVIATGFEDEEEPAPVKQSSSFESVVKPSMYDDDDDDDVPAFLRNRKL